MGEDRAGEPARIVAGLALADVPLVAGMPRRQLKRVERLADPISYEAGSKVLGSDEVGDTFYVILEGVVHVVGYGRGFVELGAGEFFGELALLDGKARLRSVVAETPIRLLRFDRQAFCTTLEIDELIHRA